MPQFTTTIDGQTHTWTLVINLGHVRDIQAAFPEFRLERILLDGDPAFDALVTDSTLLVYVLQVLLVKQLKQRGIQIEQMIEVISGPLVDEIIKALIEAVGFFCPTRAGQARAKQMVAVLEAMQKVDAETHSGDSSGTAPPVPESSPGDTASDTSATTPKPLPSSGATCSDST